MTLRRKTLLIVTLTCLALVGVLYLSSRLVVLRGFAKLEEQHVAQDVQRARSALSDDLAKLSSTVRDYAAWDETYAFLLSRESGYLRANFKREILAGLRLNFVLIFDRSGRMIFTKGLDLGSQREVAIPKSLPECLVEAVRQSPLTGLILVPEGAILVASHPILTSERGGPMRGTLVMARYLDSTEVRRLAETTHLSVSVKRLDDSEARGDFQGAPLSILPEEKLIWVRPQGPELVAGYAVLKDISGKPILMLQVAESRAIYQQGKASLLYFVVSLLGTGLVFGVVILVVLENVVLARLTHVSDTVGNIATTGDLSARIALRGRDELWRVAGAINGMLEALQRSQTERQKIEEEMRRSRDELEARIMERTAELAQANASLKAEITERQRAEQELAHERDLFHILMDNIPDTIYFKDAASRFIRINQAQAAVLGVRNPEEALGKTDLDFFPSEVAQEFFAEEERIIKTGQPIVGKIEKVTKPDGRSVWFSCTEMPIRNPKGEVTGIIGISRDITERKQSEEALRQSEEQYRLLFEADPHPMWVFDQETLRFLAVNQAALRHYGYSRDEFLAMTIKEIRPAEDIPALLREVSQPPTGLSESGVWRHRKKDGTIINVEITSHPLLFAGKRAELVLAQDVSLRKSLEEQLRQAQKMEAVGRLAGGIAHDFNNLLTIINGYSQLILDHLAMADPLREKIGEIKNAGVRAAALTRQLLAFSRQQVLAPQVLDLKSIVVGMEKMLRRLIGEDIELVTQAAPALGRVQADPSQTEQVIMNLAVNARDAMPDGGRLLMEIANVDLDEAFARKHPPTMPGSYVMLAVSDTGCGMDAQTQARIFEPFFTTKERGKGTGLGLSTVYGIVKQSGGYIWCWSEPGRGTTFRIYLPRVNEPLEMGWRPNVASAMPRGSETVLVTEDEAPVRSFVRQVLESNGYTVLEAAQGEEALSLCQRHRGPIDLLLTDVVMPQINGPELARRLMRLNPQMKVLCMSGYVDRAVVRDGVLESGMAFLQKPFTADDLAHKVREVLDK